MDVQGYIAWTLKTSIRILASVQVNVDETQNPLLMAQVMGIIKE